MAPVCVVCASPADVYCNNDDANLCFACDNTVHNANAVARNHKRTPIRDCTPRPDSLGDAVAVPQEMLPLAKPERLTDELDLSFSDEGWFTVPDTACSNTGGAVTSNKAKTFSIDDFFGFDAALDEEVAFALDPPSSDLLTDCLVPNDEPVGELTQPPVATFKQEYLEAKVQHQPMPAPSQRNQSTTAAAVSPTTAPAIAFTYPPVADNVSTVESYIPFSLRPVDANARAIELSERREKVQRFREKKKNRQFKKLIRYASRKRYAEVRPRIKGRFARKDEIAAAKAAGVPLQC